MSKGMFLYGLPGGRELPFPASSKKEKVPGTGKVRQGEGGNEELTIHKESKKGTVLLHYQSQISTTLCER